MRSRHLSVVVHRPVDEVYGLAGDPTRLPEWAAGLATGEATIHDDEFVVESPMGRVRVRFVDRNPLGVLDHEVTLPDGTRVHNPMRVLPHPAGAEVVFSIRQLEDDDDEDFERDCAMVAADLGRLRRLLERSPVSGATRAAGGGATTAEIRIASPADAAGIALLLHEFNTEFDCPSPTPAEGERRFDALLRRKDVLVVVAGRSSTTFAHGDGCAGDPEDIGFALLTFRPTPYWDGPLAQLEDLYVRPAHRSAGVGSAILDRVLAEVRIRGGEELHINVDSDDIDARRFYARHGFSDVDPESGPGMRCYLRQL